MKKKRFLLILSVCLLVCILFPTCDDDFNTPSATGLWDLIKSTAWTMENKDAIYTIGFYGPQKGPFKRFEPGPGSWAEQEFGPNYKEIADSWKYPYAVIRITSKATGNNYFTNMSRLQISRTGRISESDSYARKKHFEAKDGRYSPDYRSFNVSPNPSPDGISLSISGAKYFEEVLFGGSPENADDPLIAYINDEYKYYSIPLKINGTYTLVSSSPDYDWDL